jgi:methanogenic corrinoid protein MtbC1
MTPPSSSERVGLVQKLAAVKLNAAMAISDEFLANHPDWVESYGARGRQHCTADACFHIEFLAGAIEAGSPEAFANYSRWTARMLGSRGIGAHTLEENLAQLEKHLSAVLLPTEWEAVRIFLARGREACQEPEPAPVAQSGGEGLELTRNVFLTAILTGQRQAALNIVEDALGSGHDLVDVYVNVFAESLHRVGQLWELNQISVAQEHIATSIAQYAIAAIYRRMVPAEVKRGNMVVTGVAGELHQIGANLVADAMEAKGWAVQFLGTNLPHSSVLSVVEECSAKVLCISTTLLANLPAAAELIAVVRNSLREKAPTILLGGAAYHMAPQFAAEVGDVRAFTGLREAMAVVCA